VQLIIHIGLPKTAVTTLSYLFENSNNINFFGRPLVCLYNDIWQSMINDNQKKFKNKILNFKNKILKSLSKEKKNVLLIEGITDPFFIINNNKDFVRRLNILNKLLKIKIKIIFVMRNQSEFLLSRFVESPQFFKNYNSKWADFEQLKEPFIRQNMSKKEKIFFDYLNYYNTCKKLINYFGKKNVSLLVFEQLKNEKKIFSNKVSKILNLDKTKTYDLLRKYELNKATVINKDIYLRKNVQLNNLIINNFIYKKINKKLPRKIKYFFKGMILFLDKNFFKLILNLFLQKIIKMKKIDKELIKKYHFYDNHKSDKKFNLKLKKYNYY